MKFQNVFAFNDNGVREFKELFDGNFSQSVKLKPDFNILDDPKYVNAIEGSEAFDTDDCVDTPSMIKAIIESMGGPSKAKKCLNDSRILMWFVYALIDIVIQKDDSGAYKVRQEAFYNPPDPSNPNSFKDYKHILFNRIRLLIDFSDVAEPFLKNYPPYTVGEITEVVMSRTDSYTKNRMRLVTMLYDDPDNKKFKTGAGGKDPGSARFLYNFLSQLGMVWSLNTMTPDEIYEKLPSQFDKYK